VSVLGEPLSGVFGCCFCGMTCGGCSDCLLLALPALRFPRLRFELFEPSLMLLEEPCAVSPLSPVLADGRSSFMCEVVAGRSRFDTFLRVFPFVFDVASLARSEVELDLRRTPRLSFEDWPCEDS
jgi:hypothetical protein